MPNRIRILAQIIIITSVVKWGLKTSRDIESYGLCRLYSTWGEGVILPVLSSPAAAAQREREVSGASGGMPAINYKVDSRRRVRFLFPLFNADYKFSTKWKVGPIPTPKWGGISHTIRPTYGGRGGREKNTIFHLKNKPEERNGICFPPSSSLKRGCFLHDETCACFL